MTPSQPPNAVPVLSAEDVRHAKLDGIGGFQWTWMMHCLDAVADGRVRCVPVMTEAELREQFEEWATSNNRLLHVLSNGRRYESLEVEGAWQGFLYLARHLRLVAGGEG